jgi:hypothetical protein
MTHAGALDDIRDFGEKFVVLCGILASDEYLNRESTALDLVEIFRCRARQFPVPLPGMAFAHLSSAL